MPTRDPHSSHRFARAKALAALQNRPRVVARSRRMDVRPLVAVVALAGLTLAALLVQVLAAGSAQARFGNWTCYNLVEKPPMQQPASVPTASHQQVGQAMVPLAPLPPGARPVMPSNVAPQAVMQPTLEALPQGHQAGQVYSQAAAPRPLGTPGTSGSTGMGVVINGVWYPEPDVSRYFYYVEVPGESGTYCIPTNAEGQPDQAAAGTYGSQGGVQAPQQPAAVESGPIAGGLAVPAGYPGAPGTIFQPLTSNP